MFDGIILAITDFFRGILWAVAELFLWILDILWSIVLKIGTLDISTVDGLDYWYILILVFLSLFIVFKLAKVITKVLLDDDYKMKISLSRTLMMLALSSVLNLGVPIGFKYVCSATTYLIENVSVFVPTANNSTPSVKMSETIVQAGRVNMKDSSTDLYDVITYDSNFDINAKDDTDNYKYFAGFSNIFLAIILSVTAAFIFLMISIQIAQRIILLAFKYLMAPYAISTLIDPEDKTFGIWMKLISGDLMMNFLQIYGTYLVMFLCNNGTITRALGQDVVGLMSTIIFFLAGLLAIQELPTIISYLTGGSGKGIMQSLQDLKATTSITTGIIGGGLSAAAGVAVGSASLAGKGMSFAGNTASLASGAYKAKGGGAAGIGGAAGALAGGALNYGVAKAKNSKVASAFNASAPASKKQIAKAADLGIKNPSSLSRADLSKQIDAVENGATPEAAAKMTSGSGDYSAGSPAYDLPPTDKQLASANYFGIDGAADMSRGQLSEALDAAGAEPSIWRGYSASHTSPTSDQLNWAKHYNIPNADKMNKTELNDELVRKGVNLKNNTPSNAQNMGHYSAYKNNYKNRKMKGNPYARRNK